MVEIVIERPSSLESSQQELQQETFLIELQGELVIEGSCADAQIDIGTFQLRDNDVALLTIGQHVLEGKLVKLKNPLALISVERISRQPQVPNEGDETRSLSETVLPKYCIEKRIHYKYLFNTRPKLHNKSKDQVV